MRQSVMKYGTSLLGLGSVVMLYLIFMERGMFPELAQALRSADFQNFKILFISIILEAFPFILLGVLFSALLQVFVTDETIRKYTPRHPIAGVLFGGLLGIVFPLCECGMIPVIRRLIRKGMPAYIGIVYLLAGPIVNPIVYTSTFTAFRSTPEMAYARMAIAFGVAVVIGLLLHVFMKRSPLRGEVTSVESGCSHDHTEHYHVTPKGIAARATATLAHASDEFFEMGKYLIFGAFLTAIIQSTIDRASLVSFAEQPALAYSFMMIFAYLLSICSTSDAFIASSFGGLFSQGPLLAFLVFGPMIDFKNTLMLLSTFKIKFVLLLIVLCAAFTLIGSTIAEVWL